MRFFEETTRGQTFTPPKSLAREVRTPCHGGKPSPGLALAKVSGSGFDGGGGVGSQGHRRCPATVSFVRWGEGGDKRKGVIVRFWPSPRIGAYP